MWVDAAGTLQLTFGKLFTDQAAGAGNLGLFWLGQFVEDPGPAFYPVAFLLKATLWLLIGLILNVVFLFRNQKPETRGQNTEYGVQSTAQSTHPTNPPPAIRHLQLNTLILWLFALTYLLLMTLASKKSIRYMLPAFPTLYLLAGIGVTNLPFWLHIANRKPQFAIRNSQFIIHYSQLIALTVIIALFASILPYHPYYLTYYNPALLGWRWAPNTLLVGWGEGLDGAANYLNQTAPQATTAAWYEWLFPLLAVGPVQPVVPQEKPAHRRSRRPLHQPGAAQHPRPQHHRLLPQPPPARPHRPAQRHRLCLGLSRPRRRFQPDPHPPIPNHRPIRQRTPTPRLHPPLIQLYKLNKLNKLSYPHPHLARPQSSRR